ncbi:pirin family protein [Dysgonomonas sp. GY617]|uniref:pirin family protein n=1 Tax=Dysgonomonas sp. GY617 TaxID=2780420 RepID=UPI00188386DD|nr:pirin family protein [Dysgonomonas sp. GY617]MBF0577133.1 pirin family protein [Dysgonomonas sp. GY617]
MVKYIDSQKMGRAQHGWLDSHFHFSFAEYCNPENVRFGVLRVLNDDIVQSSEGFATHPHKDMEIISYVIQGELSHRDNMGNAHSLTRGQSQYMSAGTGITHSEYNYTDKELRFAQIWFFPDKQGYKPNYGDYRFRLEDRLDKWLPIATSYNNKESSAPIKIHADINMFATILAKEKQIEFQVSDNRQVYLVLLEGDAIVNNIHLNMRDALEIVKENIFITAKQESHFLIIEMAFDEECYKEKYKGNEEQYTGE